MSIDKQIKEVEAKFNQEISDINSNDALANLKNKYLSRKGLIADLFSQLSTVDKSKRPLVGGFLNELKSSIDQAISLKSSTFKVEYENEDSSLDHSLPPISLPIGSIHPLTKVISKIESIFSKIGFSIAYGPEVDTDFFNFEALNIPKHHPARDMQDTFYLEDGNVLRTHTSNSQIHFMLENEPPVRIIAPGRVYRNEDVSVRSYCLFHQIEGLYVDQGVTFSDLKSVLNYFARELFGNNVKTRFRPSYFPFTEPSAEMDVYWGLNSDSDRRITKGTGWLEILGCGMVDPEVFKNVKYDSNKFSGYAFGVGIERIAMLLYGIEDIREFYKGDIRFTGQFK